MGILRGAERFISNFWGSVIRLYRTHPFVSIIAVAILSICLILITTYSVNVTHKVQATQISHEVLSMPIEPTLPTPPLAPKSEFAPQVKAAPQDIDDDNQSPRTTARVEVNGRSIPIPNNSNTNIHKNFVSDDGSSQTTIDISIQSSGNSSNSSSLELDIDSSQSSFENSD